MSANVFGLLSWWKGEKPATQYTVETECAECGAKHFMTVAASREPIDAGTMWHEEHCSLDLRNIKRRVRGETGAEKRCE